MDAAKRGAEALESGKIEVAVKEYTAALAENPSAVTYYIQRSIAYARSKPSDHKSALGDAETAVVLAHKRGKAELIGQAQLRRAISLYSLGRFADCQECLNWAEKRNKGEKSIPIWRMKVEDKIRALSEGDEGGKITVTEIPDVDVESKTKLVERPKAASTSKPSTSNEANTTPSAVVAAPVAASGPAFTPPSKIRHDWYQSTEVVTVSLMAKGVPKDSATVDLQPGSLSISYPLPSGSVYDFSLEPLFARIVPEKSSYKVMLTKVEFTLAKAVPGQKWASLEGTQPIQSSSDEPKGDNEAARKAALSQPAASGPSYPTSSRSGPKDWDKLANDLTKKKKEGGKDGGEDDYDDDIEGGDDVNNFFKKLYSGADPDTQRAMMKSYVESNGTALSTNWNEVSQKQYETQPPDGMEAKKW